MAWNARFVLTLVACLLLTGCASTPQPPTNGEEPGETRTVTPPGEGQYWMIWVRGNETQDPPPQYMCSIAYDHDVDRGEKTLYYEERAYEIDTGALAWVVAFDVWERDSSCPAAYTLHTNATPVRQAIGHGPELDLFLHENGTLEVDGETWLPPGEPATFTYETEASADRGRIQVNGTYVVEHLGAWSTDDVQPGGPGA
ncbi:MAG: hypothetical protein R3185_01455 [Candidatus Thermoplasmatota archaeon]|nr:hypothetical protein [Candidatus Thermoplasmatota archaeon]